MPALQVREFPDDLYERLKACAALEHRSIAQQVVALVEEGLNARSESHYWDGNNLHRLGRASQVIDFETESACKSRIGRREALLAEMGVLPKLGDAGDCPSAAELVKRSRGKRGRHVLESCGLAGNESDKESKKRAEVE